jgi:hypothetical protein
MAEPLLHYLGMGSLLKQKRSIRMSRILQPEMTETSTLYYSNPGIAYGVGQQGLSFWSSEN